MNYLTMYTPTSSEVFYTKGRGYNSKGKSAPSYFKDPEGNIHSYWIVEHGGIDFIKNEMCKLIDLKYDSLPIAKYYNISTPTCKKFINLYLNSEYIEKAALNYKQNTFLRRSMKLKGRPSKLKGKTYLEIHGNKEVACGFRKGDRNPNFTRDKYIGCTLTNASGKKFRSSYEVHFSNLLELGDVPYQYEHHYKLCNGKVKIVDFVIGNKLVEITGYAYEKWKNDFDVKIQLLSKSYPTFSLIVISTKDKIEELKTKHSNIAVILDLNDPDLLSYFL